MNKLPELHFILYNVSYDCVFITESWLNETVSDGMLDPNRMYSIFRADRAGGTRAGGVCAFVKRKFMATEVEITKNELTELLCIDLCSYTDRQKYRMFLIYRPPDTSKIYSKITNTDYISDVIQSVTNNLNSNGTTFILGDFNCPDINWGVSNSTYLSPVSLLFYNFTVHNGFCQFVTEPTRQQNIIDLIFTNDPILISNCVVGPPFDNSDHNSIDFSILLRINYCPVNSPRGAFKKYMWTDGNFNAMNDHLLSYPWSNLLAYNLTVDKLWYAFVAVLNEAIDLFVPFKLVTCSQPCYNSRRKYPHYISKLLQRRKHLWRTLKKHPENTDLKIEYNELSKKCRKTIHQHELIAENKMIESKSVGSLFKFCNKKLKHSSNVGAILDTNGNLLIEDCDKAKGLNNYFGSVYVVDNGKLPTMQNRINNDVLNSITFDPDSVYKAMKRLKSKLTCDPDGFPPYLLKQLASSLSDPLSLIYSSFMSVGGVPNGWKRAIITPVYKKGGYLLIRPVIDRFH